MQWQRWMIKYAANCHVWTICDVVSHWLWCEVISVCFVLPYHISLWWQQAVINEEFHAHRTHTGHSAGPKTVHHRNPAVDGPQPASGQLSSLYRMTAVSGVPALHRRWRDGTASSSLLPVAHAGTDLHQLNRPIGAVTCPLPPTRNERERAVNNQ